MAGIAVNLHVRAWRKNGVEVRGDNDNFLFIHTAQFPDDVAGLVDLHVEASGGEKSFYGGGALRFEHDYTIEHKLMITASPDGFLKRV